MMRTSATRALLRPFTCTKASAAAPGLRFTHANALKLAGFPKRTESLAISAFRPITTSLVRSYASASVVRNVDREKELQQMKLGADPELVSSSSSVHALNSELGAEQKEEDVDMMAGINHDMVSGGRSSNSIGIGETAVKMGYRWSRRGVVVELLENTLANW